MEERRQASTPNRVIAPPRLCRNPEQNQRAMLMRFLYVFLLLAL